MLLKKKIEKKELALDLHYIFTIHKYKWIHSYSSKNKKKEISG